MTADGNDVVVRLKRPATDFPTIVAGADVRRRSRRRSIRDRSGLDAGRAFVGSGGYVLSAPRPTRRPRLEANDHYWAGRPPIATVELVHDIGGRSSVAAFEDGDVD